MQSKITNFAKFPLGKFFAFPLTKDAEGKNRTAPSRRLSLCCPSVEVPSELSQGRMMLKVKSKYWRSLIGHWVLEQLESSPHLKPSVFLSCLATCSLCQTVFVFVAVIKTKQDTLTKDNTKPSLSSNVFLLHVVMRVVCCSVRSVCV